MGTNRGPAMNRFEIGNDNVSLRFATGPVPDGDDPSRTGIQLERIADPVLPRDYLISPPHLFEYSVNNGPPRISSHHLEVTNVVMLKPGREVRIEAQDRQHHLSFQLHIVTDGDRPAVLIGLTVTSSGSAVFLRMVYPRLLDLRTWPPVQPSAAHGMVPMEIGRNVPLAGLNGPWCDNGIERPGTVGMPYIGEAKRIGLPTSMNTMELASYHSVDGGGLFVADIDNDVERAKAPVQLTMSLKGVAGFWVAELKPGVAVETPRVAIGVHPDGDWHAAVDYYVEKHRQGWRFPQQPAWFDDQAAIYTHSGGGAGGMYLSNTIENLADGAIGTYFEVDGVWPPAGPVPISHAGLAPAGAPLAVAVRPAKGEDLFVVDRFGALAWTPMRGGVWGSTRQITPPDVVPVPGWLAAVARHDEQVDVFFVDKSGALRSVYGPAADALSWHAFQLSKTGSFPAGAPVAAITRHHRDVDVFAVDNDRAVCWTYARNNGPWLAEPLKITKDRICASRSHLVALPRNPVQTDIFFIDADGRMATVFKTTSADDVRQWKIASWGDRLAPAGAAIAAIVRKKGNNEFANDEDVFVVGDGGAIQHTAMRNNGGWSVPAPLTVGNERVGFAPAGAPITAVATTTERTDLFFVDGAGALVRLCRTGAGPWERSRTPDPPSLPLYSVPQAATAAAIRNAQQLDVFLVMQGRLRSFRDLPNLLREARQLGTDVVYLHDYWDGRPRVDADRSGRGPFAWAHPPYFNKGDYLPREDLGGAQALREGIANVHAAGGRVILYVEPFIIFVDSRVARTRRDPDDPKDQGEYLAGRFPSQKQLLSLIAAPTEWGTEWRIWKPSNHTMVPSLPAWVDHIAEVVDRLTNDYGADGIFLDSFGWQMNYPMYVEPHRGKEGIQQWPIDYARGVLKLTDVVRTVIGPDRVVLAETPAGPIGRHCHGGVSADFGFPGDPDGIEKITASPVRYGIPEIRYFSNGGSGDYSLNRLHQIFAAGHGLALCHQHLVENNGEHADHIRHLVDIRRTHSDTLIRGRQTYQPMPEGSGDAVAAYCYRGPRGTTILTVVNTARTDYSGRLRLRPEHAWSSWVDLLSGRSFAATGTTLPIALPGAGQSTTRDLLVLHSGSWLEPVLHTMMGGSGGSWLEPVLNTAIG